MAWEWVAPVATGALGATGIVFTWLSGKQGRDHAENLAKLRNDHDSRMAREERTQQRLANAYIALLEMAERMGGWVQTVRLNVNLRFPSVPLPDIDEQMRVSALIGAYGSTAVRSRLDAWRGVVYLVRALDMQIGSSQERAVDTDADHWERLEEARPKEKEARTALTDQIAAELGHWGDDRAPAADSSDAANPNQRA